MSDIIAAIATGGAPGGVGIIRLSGPGAGQLAQQLVKTVSGRPLLAHRARQLVYGDFCARDGSLLDRGLAFYASAPHSYTGEDTAELQCHGSPMVLGLLLEELFALGARQALAGEFTRRAFLNGRLDLMQAEAVIDLIDAETPAGAKLAASQLGGSLSCAVEEIYSGLTDLLAHFYAVLDYPDEDIDPFRAETIAKALETARQGTQRLLDSYERGRQLRGGVACAILGKPNVGKSSLLNCLSGHERAIVTDVPGTTRDTVEERATLGKVTLRLIDTAGLRETGDAVEQLGVARSREAARQAQLVLLVLDGSRALEPEDTAAMELARQAPHCLCLVNKCDLPQALDRGALPFGAADVLDFSARQGTGLAELSARLETMFPTASAAQTESFLSNLRQKEAAARALDALQQAQKAFDAGLAPDLVLFDVESALKALGELSGRAVQEDVTDRIFSRFCVGK